MLPVPIGFMRFRLAPPGLVDSEKSGKIRVWLR